MRRQRKTTTPLLDVLMARWRARGDPRAAALERGEAVSLSVDELPADRRPERDICMGFDDDFELRPTGQLASGLGYFRRRLETPLPYRGGIV